MIRYSKLAQSRVKGEIAATLEKRGSAKEETLHMLMYSMRPTMLLIQNSW